MGPDLRPTLSVQHNSGYHGFISVALKSDCVNVQVDLGVHYMHISIEPFIKQLVTYEYLTAQMAAISIVKQYITRSANLF